MLRPSAVSLLSCSFYPHSPAVSFSCYVIAPVLPLPGAVTATSIHFSSCHPDAILISILILCSFQSLMPFSPARAVQAASIRASKTAMEFHNVRVLGTGNELLLFAHGVGHNMTVSNRKE